MNSIIKVILILTISINNVIPQGPPINDVERKSFYGSTFQKIVCKSFDNSTGYLRNCFVRAYSKQFVSMNFGYKLYRPLEKPFFVRLIISYRYGTIYRDVLDTKNIDWCAVMEGAASNLLFTQFLRTFKNSIPKLFHKCPYENEADFFNITLDESDTRKLTIFPEGQYKYSVTISKPADKPLANMCISIYTKSPMKDSFG